jgi:hypothetical protein
LWKRTALLGSLLSVATLAKDEREGSAELEQCVMYTKYNLSVKKKPRPVIGLIINSYQLPKVLSDLLNFTVAPDSNPGPSLDSRLRGNDGKTPISARLQDSLHRTAKRTLFFGKRYNG